jgi:hypothetical protein
VGPPARTTTARTPTAAADAPGAEASGPAAGIEAATVALDEGRTVIDVRTVEEYDAGHIDGAERIGLADPDFAERIAGPRPRRDLRRVLPQRQPLGPGRAA